MQDIFEKIMLIAAIAFCSITTGNAQGKWDCQQVIYTNDTYHVSWQLPTNVKWNANNELIPGEARIMNVTAKKANIACLISTRKMGYVQDVWNFTSESIKKITSNKYLDFSICDSKKTYVKGIKAFYTKHAVTYKQKLSYYEHTIIFYHNGYQQIFTVRIGPKEEKRLSKSGEDVESAYFGGIM